MKHHLISKLIVVLILLSCSACKHEKQQKSDGNLSINVACYNYDRIRAIMDGRVSIDGADVSFNVENIYDLNNHVFGPENTYAVTEMGLIPYITQYINNDFRDYTLIPVFISRIFRHRNVFVSSNSGIEKPEDLIGKKIGTPRIRDECQYMDTRFFIR